MQRISPDNDTDVSDTPISSVTAAMSDLMSGAELPTAAAGSLVSSSVSDRESVVTCQLATQEDEFTKIQVRTLITIVKCSDQHCASRVIECLSAPTMSMVSPLTATSRTGSQWTSSPQTCTRWDSR